MAGQTLARGLCARGAGRPFSFYVQLCCGMPSIYGGYLSNDPCFVAPRVATFHRVRAFAAWTTRVCEGHSRVPLALLPAVAVVAQALSVCALSHALALGSCRRRVLQLLREHARYRHTSSRRSGRQLHRQNWARQNGPCGHVTSGARMRRASQNEHLQPWVQPAPRPVTKQVPSGLQVQCQRHSMQGRSLRHRLTGAVEGRRGRRHVL